MHLLNRGLQTIYEAGKAAMFVECIADHGCFVVVFFFPVCSGIK